MTFKYAYVLPILSGIWFPATFIITYIIAVCNKDVTPVFPYISDTGTWSPESCIFGLMLNIGAIILGLIMYIRYRQVRDLLDKIPFEPNLGKFNKSAFILGIIASFGISVVGNFQETNILLVHLTGAMAAFGLGTVFQCIQTYISFQLYPNLGNKKINITRVFCCIVSCITLCITSIFAGISYLQFTGDDITKWTKEDGGYVNHFISAVTEWILALATIFFCCLFTEEFRKISLSEPSVSEIVP